MMTCGNSWSAFESQRPGQNRYPFNQLQHQRKWHQPVMNRVKGQNRDCDSDLNNIDAGHSRPHGVSKTQQADEDADEEVASEDFASSASALDSSFFGATSLTTSPWARPGHDYALRFVAPLLPKFAIRCEVGKPPSIQLIVAAIFDYQGGSILNLGDQLEVTLDVYSGSAMASRSSSAPFAGGFYYFEDINYASDSPGRWKLALTVRILTGSLTCKSLPKITPCCHEVDVYFTNERQ